MTNFNGYFNKIYLDSVVCHVQYRSYGRYLSPINNDRLDIEPVDIDGIFVRVAV